MILAYSTSVITIWSRNENKTNTRREIVFKLHRTKINKPLGHMIFIWLFIRLLNSQNVEPRWMIAIDGETIPDLPLGPFQNRVPLLKCTGLWSFIFSKFMPTSMYHVDRRFLIYREQCFLVAEIGQFFYMWVILNNETGNMYELNCWKSATGSERW